jgi:hypothetical protein
MGAVASTIRWTAASSFMVSGFMSSERGYLSDPVVDPHEVGVFGKLGDEFARVYPLSLTCYRGDRHEALFGGCVHLVGDFVKSLREIPDGESFTKSPALFILLPVAFTLGILVVGGFISGRIGGQLIF